MTNVLTVVPPRFARVAVLALLLPAAQAGAQEAAVSASSQPPAAAASSATSTRVAWHANNRNERSDDDDFGVAIVRTNLALDGGDTRASVRIDGEGFTRPPGPIATARQNDLRLERVSLQLDRETSLGPTNLRGQLALGDFYTQFGRGLVLSLRRLDEIGVDLALRGARGDLSLTTDAGSVDLQVVGGTTNAVNLESQQLYHVDDPRDRIAGARLAGRRTFASLGATEIGLGGHAVAFRDSVASATGARQAEAFGGTLDLLVGGAALGVEIDGQRRSPGPSNDGWAAYLVATLPLGTRVTLLGEAKHYVRFVPLTGSPLSSGEGRFVYNQAPTAERIDQELIDDSDVTGGRLRSDVALDDAGSSAHASFGLFANRSTAQWISHGFGGLDLRRDSGLALGLAAGYRREWLVADGTLARAIVHGELDFMARLHQRVGLHLITRHESHAEATGPARYVFHRGGVSLEADLWDRLVLGGGTDWDTQNQNPAIARRFGFGVLRWRHSDAFIVQLLAGSQRGGIRCIAGACRLQAPFAGVRTDITVLF